MVVPLFQSVSLGNSAADLKVTAALEIASETGKGNYSQKGDSGFYIFHKLIRISRRTVDGYENVCYDLQ